MRKGRSLFSRLIWSVAIPELLMFSMLAWISFIEVYNMIREENEKQTELIRDEVKALVDFMNVSSDIIEMELNERLSLASDEMVNFFFYQTDSIETADLSDIKLLIGLEEETEHINIVDSSLRVVNSTNLDNLGVDYSSYGETFSLFMHSTLNGEGLVLEQFTYNMSSHRIKKFSYMPTRDHKYLVELEFSSRKGNIVLEKLRSSIDQLADNSEEILSLDLIFGYIPYSFVTTEKISDDVELAIIDSVRTSNMSYVIDGAYQFENLAEKNLSGIDLRDKSLVIEYTPIVSEDNKLFKEVIIREIKDSKYEEMIVVRQLSQKVLIFLVGMTLLFVILLVNARNITRPIKRLLKATRVIGEGKFDEKVEVKGNRELRELATSFNEMAERLDESNKKILEQKEVIETRNREISDSINYAQRIQVAILPPLRWVGRHLESFVYYRPKDVVAGDFYWFVAKDDSVFFASADCTGHGVPGAMVSVVCSNALNRAVNEMNLSEPAEILDQVRDFVVKTFEESDQEVKDGMDIAFCRFDVKQKKLVYAGAHNSMYRLTALTEKHEPSLISNDEYVVEEYKADKQPIGQYSHPKPFSQTEVKLKKGDSIYLSTDGFPDQFGGPKGRKYMYKRFKEFLLSIHPLDMEKQKEKLDAEFNRWKGSQEQIDDVCVIGVKI